MFRCTTKVPSTSSSPRRKERRQRSSERRSRVRTPPDPERQRQLKVAAGARIITEQLKRRRKQEALHKRSGVTGKRPRATRLATRPPNSVRRGGTRSRRVVGALVAVAVVGLLVWVVSGSHHSSPGGSAASAPTAVANPPPATTASLSRAARLALRERSQRSRECSRRADRGSVWGKSGAEAEPAHAW